MRQRAAGVIQQLQRVIQARRVALARPDDREQPLDILDLLGVEQRLARVHPVHIAALGVDFAVVRQIAERLRQIPARERVRGITLVHQRQRRRQIRVIQVGVELLDLIRQQQALVNEAPAGKRRHAEIRLLRQPAAVHRMFRALADHHQDPLENVFVEHFLRPADEDLPERRHVRTRQHADRIGIGRHLAPAQEDLPLFDDHLLHRAHAPLGLFLRPRQENHARPIVTHTG